MSFITWKLKRHMKALAPKRKSSRKPVKPRYELATSSYGTRIDIYIYDHKKGMQVQSIPDSPDLPYSIQLPVPYILTKIEKDRFDRKVRREKNRIQQTVNKLNNVEYEEQQHIERQINEVTGRAHKARFMIVVSVLLAQIICSNIFDDTTVGSLIECLHGSFLTFLSVAALVIVGLFLTHVFCGGDL